MPRSDAQGIPESLRNIDGLPEDTTPDLTADYLVAYDVSTDTHTKVKLNAVGGGGGTPGGSNKQFQYNNATAFGGTSGLEWDGTNETFAGTQALRFRDANSQINASAAGYVDIKGATLIRLRTAGLSVLDFTAARVLLSVPDSAVAENYLEIQAGDAGEAIKLVSQTIGADTNRSIDIQPAGTGRLTVNGVNVPTISSTDTFTNKTINASQLVDASVTLAKMANAAANSKLLGSGDAGVGASYVELTLGTNLSMSGTTLNATGGGTTLPVADTQTIVKGSVTDTKLLRFEIDGWAGAVTRVLTPPDADITIAGINLAQTWTAAQTLGTTTKLQLTDADGYLHASSTGAVKLYGLNSVNLLGAVVNVYSATTTPTAQFVGVASSANYFTFTPTVTGGTPILSVAGDANSPLIVKPAGTGLLTLGVNGDTSLGYGTISTVAPATDLMVNLGTSTGPKRFNDLRCNTATFSSNVAVQGTLSVTGNTTVGSAFAVTASTGATATGPLTVTGAATISSTLGVTNATTLSSTLALTGTASLTNKIIKYNNITTVSGGVPSELATIDLSLVEAAKAAVALYTPVAAGMFRVSVVLTLTRAATTSSVLAGTTAGQQGVSIAFQTGDGLTSITQAILLKVQAVGTAFTNTSAANVVGTTLIGSEVIYAAASAITYNIGYTSVGATTMQYSIHMKVEAL